MSDMIESTKSYIAQANTCLWLVSAKKHSTEALFGSKAARFNLMMYPAFANKLTVGVVVTQSHLRAISAIAGKRCKAAC